MASELDNALRDPEQRATLAFLAVPGVGPGTCATLREKFGSLAAAIEAGPALYLEHLRAEAREEHAPHASLIPLAEQIVADCEKLGARILFRGGPEWPKALKDLGKGEPELLFVRGTLVERAHAVAVVGTREPTEIGLKVATRIGERMAEAGILVVSGGAKGIDGAAHAGAIKQSGATWVVLGGGFLHLFPPENVRLFDEIVAKGGALITEVPPRHEVKERLFPRRNRLVAALAQATVVVQGGEDSGALLTARDVLKLNQVHPDHPRRLLAVPGDVGEPMSKGPHLLLRTGVARICGESVYLLIALGLKPELEFKLSKRSDEQAPAPGESFVSRPALPPLDASLEPVYRAIEAAPKHFDALASQVRWPAPELLAALTQLELLGMVEQRPGKFFVRRGG